MSHSNQWMCLCVAVVTVIGPRAYGARVKLTEILPAPSSVWCEYLLQSEDHIEQATDWVVDAFARTEQFKKIGVVEDALEPALKAFALENVSSHHFEHLILRTTAPLVTTGKFAEYKLTLGRSYNAEVLDHESFAFSKLLAWQKTEVALEELESGLNRHLNGSSYGLEPIGLERLAVGLTLSESQEAGRKFLTVEAISDMMYGITLGIDVDCDKVAQFSKSEAIMRVRANDKWLCRVPVLRASAFIERDLKELEDLL